MSVTHAILGLLLERDRHGYEIATALARRIPGGPYNNGQIHQGLEQCEGRGWAVSREEQRLSRNRRPFSITPAGRQEFLSWLRREVPVTRPQRDEIVVKLAFLGRHDRERLIEVLEARRADLEERSLEHDRAVARPGEEIDHLVDAVFRFREEAELRWTDYCLERLRSRGGRRSDPEPKRVMQA